MVTKPALTTLVNAEVMIVLQLMAYLIQKMEDQNIFGVHFIKFIISVTIRVFINLVFCKNQVYHLIPKCFRVPVCLKSSGINIYMIKSLKKQVHNDIKHSILN